MKKFFVLFGLASLSMSAASGFGAECVLKITREACAGKEAEAFKPYNGEKTTTEPQKKVTSADDCAKAAEKSSKIVRKGTLGKKSVVATFDGAAVEGGKTWTDEKECK